RCAEFFVARLSGLLVGRFNVAGGVAGVIHINVVVARWTIGVRVIVTRVICVAEPEREVGTVMPATVPTIAMDVTASRVNNASIGDAVIMHGAAARNVSDLMGRRRRSSPGCVSLMVTTIGCVASSNHQ